MSSSILSFRLGRWAAHLVSRPQYQLRSLRFNLMNVRRAVVDCNFSRLHCLWHLTNQVDSQDTVVERGILYLDVVSKTELPLERSSRDPVIQVLTFLFALPAFNRDHVLLRCHIYIGRREAGQCQRNLVPVVRYPFDVVRRIGFLVATLRSIDEIYQTVEADRGTPQGREVKGSHSQILHRARWIRAGTGPPPAPASRDPLGAPHRSPRR